MKRWHLSFYLLILSLCNCKNNLNSVEVIPNPIPVPTAETIAYITKRDEGFHIRVSNSDYSKSYRLTSFGLAIGPDWSSDKQWITYTKAFQIWKMRYDGTGKTVLTPTGIEAQASRFSPDGTKLVFVVTRPQNELGFTLYTVGSDGRQLRQIIADTVVARRGLYSFIWPDWSPDGRKICFSYARLDTNAFQSYIGIFNLETKIFTQVSWIDDRLLPAEPRWSPNRDELIVMCALKQGGVDIWRVNIDGSHPIQLTNTKRSRAPEWSSDGEYFLYEISDETMSAIWKMKRDGSENKQIIIDEHPYGAEPTW